MHRSQRFTICLVFGVSVLLSCPTRTNGVPCPLQCYCDNTAVTCSDPGLEVIPPIPTRTKSLIITATKLTIIPLDSFSNLTSLTSLSVTDNPSLARIAPGAFSGLTKLETLSLARNALTRDSFSDSGAETFRPLRESLIRLDLSGNRFDLVPHEDLRLLGSLRELNVSDNALRSAVLGSGVQSMDRLEVIDLSGNRLLRSLGPTTFRALSKHTSSSPNKSIYLLRCGLTEIRSGTFNGLPNIDHIDLSDNPALPRESITNVMNDLGTTLYLRKLSLSNVNLTEIGDLFRPLQTSKLQSLDLSNNRLERIEENAFRYLSNMVEMSLAGNRLQHLQGGIFNRLSKLKTLDVDDNHLVSWSSQAFETITDLSKLTARRNRFTTIDTEAFSKLYGLKELALDGNQIMSVGAVDNLQEITKLSLSDNQLDSLAPFAPLLLLESLDLSHNRLTRVHESALNSGSKLKNLNLSHNRITETHPRAFAKHSPETIDLSHNFVALLPNEGWYSVVSLSLAHNRVEYIPRGAFHDAFLLKHLDLSGNLLEKLAPDMFDHISYSLTELKLSENLLGHWVATAASPFTSRQSSVSIDGSSLKIPLETGTGSAPSGLALTTLDLSSNGIKAIRDGFFKNLTRLRSLKLSDNSISSLTEESLNGLNILERLDISGNKLSTISPLAFSSTPSLSALDASGNSFTCDCSLTEFTNWKEGQGQSSVSATPHLIGWDTDGQYTCMEPPSRVNIDLKDLDLSSDKCRDGSSERTIILIVIGCTAFVIIVAVSALFWQHRWRLKRRIKKERYRAMYEASSNQTRTPTDNEKESGEQSEVFLQHSGPSPNVHHYSSGASHSGGTPPLASTNSTPHSGHRSIHHSGANGGGGKAPLMEMSPRQSRHHSAYHMRSGGDSAGMTSPSSAATTLYAAPGSQYSSDHTSRHHSPARYHFEVPPPPASEVPPLPPPGHFIDPSLASPYHHHQSHGGHVDHSRMRYPGSGVAHSGVAYVPTGVSSGGSSSGGSQRGGASSQSQVSNYSSLEYHGQHGGHQFV